MRVVHVSYSVDGGAGRSALRLHQNLLDLGIDSLIFAFDEATTSPPSFDPGTIDRVLGRYMRNIDKLPNKWRGSPVTASWSNNWAPNFTLQRVSELKPDIVHFHFIGAGTFPVRDFKSVPCPIVWTLHDMWAFTGGCHYTGGCVGFSKKCGRCPTLRSSTEDDLSRTNWSRKSKEWEHVKLTLVSPSNWLADQARQSSLMELQKVMVIPYGIDLKRFSPKDRIKARQTFDVSNDKFVIAFGAARLTDARKGLDLLWAAIRRFNATIATGNCELLVFGGGDWNPSDSPIPIRNVGMIEDDQKLALLYSAANVFCAPSREENLANTALESLGCGTPVMAFRIGGFPDIIDHRRTGYLAEPFEVDGLVDGLEFLYSRYLAGEDFIANCRDRAERLYDGRINANQYIELYKALSNLNAGQTSVPLVSR